jgi:hypothetical protein
MSYARNNSEYQPIDTGAWHVMVKRGFNRRHKLSKAHAGVDLSLECPNDGVFKGMSRACEVENILQTRPFQGDAGYNESRRSVPPARA